VAGTSTISSSSGAYAALSSINVAPPVWPAFTFSPGILGNPFTQDFDLSPAASPTTFTLLSGTLLNGLSLWNVGGDVGRLWGFPVATGTFTFTLRASNAYGTADKPFTITVSTPIISGSTTGAALF
jgi:hypothetical protein